jgi:bifunctional DNA-binding transcriptional regulator/antitoxin component of YhaV-PrlF toxin-antitoxin module
MTKTQAFFSTVDEEGVLYIPEEILDSQGWGVGTELSLRVLDDGNIEITKYDSYKGGCGGDILTDEEKEVLEEKGLKGFMQLPQPWDNQ